MKKLLILCCALLTLNMARAQWPNVSTGISTTGSALGNLVQDPNWHLGLPNPIVPTNTYVQPYIQGAWNPTPVTTNNYNAGWINPSTSPFNDVPGIYAFERNFTVSAATATGSFTTNFRIANDDDLISLKLIPPGNGTPITLTVVHNTNHNPPQYYLSNLIKRKVTCPKIGVWTIRAEINYVDQIGGFLLSGQIDTTVGDCNTCVCDTTCKLKLTVGGLSGSPFSCGKTLKLNCNKNYDFSPQLSCSGAGCTTTISGITLKDPSNNTPVWASSFIANNGTGSLSIPAGIPAGIYTLTYTYGVPGKKCGTCTYKLNITCKCNCALSLVYEGNNSVDTVTCGDTIKAVCGRNTLYTPSLKCTGTSAQLTGFHLTDASGNIPAWASTFTGAGALFVPAGISGTFTLTYIWGSTDATPCDSCKLYLNVLCCPATPCTLTATIKKAIKGGTTQTLRCGDTTLTSCGVGYTIIPTLKCSSDTATHISSATLLDANGNTPSWAATFISNNGSGTLNIPAGVSGYYTLTYYWGFGSTICGSCRMVIKVQCCTGFSVKAGPDITTCCPSAGTQLTASVSGGSSPYIYSWSPTSGLNNPNIANPISTSTGTYVVTVKDVFGCITTDTVKVIYCGVNGCRIAGNATKSQAYPNPFKNGFTLKIPANSVANIRVTNVYGTTVESKQKASGTIQMGAKLTYGVYTVFISYEDGTKEQIKMVKNPD